LIEHRGLPTIYGNYDHAIARDLDDCGCAYVTPHDRELGQRSVVWTLAHTDQHSKDFMRELPFDLRFELDHAGDVTASIKRVPYDAAAVAREVAAAGLPGEYAQKLITAA
jgi:hypothetical protein